MGSFTMTLEEVIEMEGVDNIGLSEYPIFDEEYRANLNQKIIDRYYNQEIGQETISMFRLAMKRKMNEIMPLYNEHYRLSQITIDALMTADMVTESSSTGSAEGTNTATTLSKSDAKSRAVASNFPQNSLQADSDYATSAQDNISDSNATADSSDSQNSEQTTEGKTRMSGYQGHQPELIFAARQTIVNIDVDILESLQTLFMGVWGTAAEYTRANTHYDNYPYAW